jgi:hypothetical protein
MSTTFTHQSGKPVIVSPGRRAAGNEWRASFTPTSAGQWYFTVSFRRGSAKGEPVRDYDNLSGIFPVTNR